LFKDNVSIANVVYLKIKISY